MSANSRRAGGAYIEIGARTAALQRGLKKAQAQLNSFAGAAMSQGAKFMAAGAAIGAPLMVATKEFASYGDNIAKAARRTALAVDSISALNVHAQLSGTSIASLEKATKAMARGIFDAKRGAGEMKDAMAEMNMSYTDLEGLSPEEQFWKLADSIAAIEDPTIKQAVAMKVFGRAGADLIPMLDAGSAAMEETRRRASALGLVLDEEAAAKAEVLTDQFTWLSEASRGIKLSLGSALADTLSTVIEMLVQGSMSAVAWIKANKEMVVTAAKVAAGLVATGGAIIAVGLAAKGAAMFIGIAGSVLKTLAVVFQPVVLAATAAAVGITLFADAVLSTLGYANLGFSDFVQGIKVGGSSIQAWLSVAWLYVMEGFERMLTGLKVGWNSLVLSAKTVGSKIYQALAGVANMIANAFWTSVKGVADAIAWLAEKTLDTGYALNIIDTAELAKGMGAINKLKAGVGDIAKEQKGKADNLYGNSAAESEKANDNEWRKFYDNQKKIQTETAKRMAELKQTVARIFAEDEGKEDSIAKYRNAATAVISKFYKEVDKLKAEMAEAMAKAEESLKKRKKHGAGTNPEDLKLTPASPKEVFGTFSARAAAAQATNNPQDKEIKKSNKFLRSIAETNKRIADYGQGLA